MRVLLNSQGSTGDIYPVIALGKALLESGHSVRLATAPLFKDEVKRAGLDYIYIPPDWTKEVFAACMLKLVRAPHSLKQLEIIYRSGIPYIEDTLDRLEKALEDTDLYVCSYLFPHFKVRADRHGIPFAVVCFGHMTVPSPDYPPNGVPTMRTLPKGLQRKWNYAWWKITDMMIHRTVNKTLAASIKKGITTPVKQFIFAPADLALVAVSKKLIPAHAEIDSRFQYVGHLRWQSRENPQLDEDLEAFCAGREVPVLTFGSVTFDRREHKMRRFLRHWPNNRKIIIQRGWVDLSPEKEHSNIKVIDQVSHDQLFRHASCVIHHGGAGTTASVWHSGKPGIVIPHIADQFFWARETRHLEVGHSISKRRWPELLPKIVPEIENDQRLRKNAENLASELTLEDGGKTAVGLLEQFVRDYGKS